MSKCRNCGRKTYYDDFCQWCHYPLSGRRLPRRARRMTPLKKLATQVELKAEQITKVDKKAVEVRTTAMGKKEDKAMEQIAEQAAHTKVDSFELERHRHGVPGGVEVMDKIKVFVIDSQGLFRQGLRLLLSQTDNIELIGESDFLEDTIAIIEELAPDIVIIDIKLPSLSGLDLAQRVRQRLPRISLIMLTPYEDHSQILEALKAGVAAYLSKSITPEGLVSAIRRIFKGEHIVDELLRRPSVAPRVLMHLQGMQKKGLIKPLSPQEIETLIHFANGHSLKRIADTIGVSEQEIINHTASILSKLAANGVGPANSTSA